MGKTNGKFSLFDKMHAFHLGDEKRVHHSPPAFTSVTNECGEQCSFCFCWEIRAKEGEDREKVAGGDSLSFQRQVKDVPSKEKMTKQMIEEDDLQHVSNTFQDKIESTFSR